MSMGIPAAPIAAMTKEEYVNPNSLTRKEREEMMALSKEVFGNTSKWKNILDRGFSEKVTKTVKEQVPQADGTTKEVETQKAVLNENGQEWSVHKYYTLPKLKELMLNLKEQIKTMNENMAKQREEAEKAKAAAEQTKKIQESAGGSAI